MLEVRLLGQFEVLLDGLRLAIPTRNAQSLFAYLLLDAGHNHRREKLAGLLWPDSSEENARSNLRHELWRLRKAFKPEGDAYFLVDELTIAFNPKSEFTLDVEQLERVPLEESQVEDLIAAISVYHGELLPGFYEEWVFSERDRLHGLFEAKMARLLELLQTAARWAEVLEWGMRWISLGGWPEPAYRALMMAYAESGDIPKAVATYERLSQGLQKELGVKPSGQSQALYKSLKSGWQLASPAKTQAGNTGRANSAPQTGSPATHSPRVHRTNLPKPLTSFIGREKETRQVEQLLSRSRLVTITGSSGVGKTRLAIQVAGALSPGYRDGVWWVELASLFEAGRSQKKASPLSGEAGHGTGHPAVRRGELRGADLVAQAVSKALRVPETPGLSLIEAVLDHLGDRQLLLVLDNCEHLIEGCAILVAELLAGCPEVTVLATSREALGVPGEKPWNLPSLTLPKSKPGLEPRELDQSEAIRLFVERAADVVPGYQPGEADWPTIAQICLQLDGIPLAIELAAARMNLLSAEEIAARLDRRFNLLTAGHRTALPHHQTLLAAIEWSYDLLGEQERVLFRRLAVFAGNFSLEAAEAVCAGEGIVQEEALTLLGRLVDKSLLSVEPAHPGSDLGTRYRLLETIRSYGDLKLEAAGETRRLRDRHAEFYVRLVEEAEPELLRENQGYWYRLLLAENDNLRGVVEWATASDQAESALRMVGSLLWFWWSHGSSWEGLDLVQRSMALNTASQHLKYRARALNTAAYLQWVLGDIAAARQNIDEALEILRETNDPASLGWSMQFLGLVLTSEGKYDLADEAMLEGISIAWKVGDLQISSFSLAFRGDIAQQQGDLPKATRIYKESAELLREVGNKLFLAYPLRRLGYIALEQGDYRTTWENFKESLALNLEGGDQRGVAACLAGLAVLAERMEEPALAAQLYGQVESRLESNSTTLLYMDQAEYKQLYNRLVARMEEESFTTAYAAGWGMSIEQALERVGEIVERRLTH